MAERYLSADDIRKIIPIGRSTVYELFKREDFPAIHIGKRLFVSETALYKWLNDGGSQNVKNVKEV